MSEAKLMRDIQVEAARLGVRLFRNQVGSYMLADGRWLSSGLVVGSSDLIGWTPVQIGGEIVAVFTAIETKFGNQKATKEQELFLRQVNHSGGIGMVAYSVDEVLAVIRGRDNNGI